MIGASNDARADGEQRGYDAFISYSHAADGKLAPRLQEALQAFAKPWYRRRALTIFRDNSSLSATPNLWPTIQNALEGSRYFLLLASPEAAASRWVQQEVDWWLAHKSAEKLLIVLTDGELSWDNSAEDFDWRRTDALPSNLKNAYPVEPRWIEMRWAKQDAQLSPKDPKFQDVVADLAAPLRGRPKEDLVGEDVRQHRRALFLARAAVAALLVLVTGLTLATGVAFNQRDSAITAQIATEQQRNIAEQRGQVALGRQLAAQADLLRSEYPNLLPLSVTLAIESVRRVDSVETDGALRRALQLLPREVAQVTQAGTISTVEFSRDGQQLLTAAKLSGGADYTVRIWDLRTGEKLTLQHEGNVEAALFSPDGRQVVTASEDQTARVWDTATGHELLRLPHPQAVTALAVSPDGNLIATGVGYSRQGKYSARLWDAQSGRQSAELSDDSEFRALAFSPDGRLLSTATAGRIVRVWNVATNTEVASVMNGDGTWDVAFSPDSSQLATASEDGTARIWDLASGREHGRMIHDRDVVAVRFSPDGTQLATASADRTARIWDVKTGRQLFQLAHADSVNGLVYSPSGAMLATASEDRTARVWDARTGQELARLAEDGRVKAVAFSPNERVVAAGGDDHSAQIWEVGAGRDVMTLLHPKTVAGVAFTSDSTRVATFSFDNTARVWDTRTGRAVARLTHTGTTPAPLPLLGSTPPAYLTALTFSPDGRQLATASTDQTARVWDVQTGNEILRLSHEGSVRTVAFSPDGARLGTGSEDRTARIWDSHTGAELGRLSMDADISTLVFNADGTRVAAAGGDHTIAIWDGNSGHEPLKVAHRAGATSLMLNFEAISVANANEVNRYMTGLAFSPDGNRLASAGIDGRAHIWDVQTGKDLVQMVHDGAVLSLAYNPAGTQIVTTSTDRTARIWDAATGRRIATLPHEHWVWTASFSADGREVITASVDRTARVWDAATGRELVRLDQAGQVHVAAFSPDGRQLFTGGEESARLWLRQTKDLVAEACDRLSRNLTHDEWTRYLSDEPYRPTCADLP